MRPVAPLYITTDYNRSKKIFLLNGRMPHFSEDYYSPKNKSFNVNLNTFISLGLLKSGKLIHQNIVEK